MIIFEFYFLIYDYSSNFKYHMLVDKLNILFDYIKKYFVLILMAFIGSIK